VDVRCGGLRVKSAVIDDTLFPVWHEVLEIAPLNFRIIDVEAVRAAITSMVQAAGVVIDHKLARLLPSPWALAPPVHLHVFDRDRKAFGTISKDYLASSTVLPASATGAMMYAARHPDDMPPTWLPLTGPACPLGAALCLAAQVLPTAQSLRPEYALPASIRPESRRLKLQLNVLSLSDLVPYHLCKVKKPIVEFALPGGRPIRISPWSADADAPTASAPTARASPKPPG
jgi:hypothetical protein